MTVATPDSLTPGQRLVQARWNLRQIAETWLSEPGEARDFYATLTAAAREMVTAQDAFNATLERADR